MIHGISPDITLVSYRIFEKEYRKLAYNFINKCCFILSYIALGGGVSFSLSDATPLVTNISAGCLKKLQGLEKLKKMQKTEEKCLKIDDFLEWFYLQKGELGFEEAVDIFTRHPTWPNKEKTFQIAEKKISNKTSKAIIRRWFSQHDPVTAEGMVAYETSSSGEEKKGKLFLEKVQKFWVNHSFESVQKAKDFHNFFLKYIGSSDHLKRIERLLWDENIELAQSFIQYAPLKSQKTLMAWMAAIQGGANIKETHPFFSYKSVKNLYDSDKPILATEKFLAEKSLYIFGHLDKIHLLKSQMIRSLLKLKRYDLAYRLSKHSSTTAFQDKSKYVENLWLKGLLGIGYKQNVKQGVHDLKVAYSQSKVSRYKSHYAFWVAEGYRQLKNIKQANHWYALAAKYPQMYYGQLASKRLGQSSSTVKPAKNRKEKLVEFNQIDLVRMIKYLHAAGHHQTKNVFLFHLAQQVKPPHAQFVLELACRLSTPYAITHVYEILNQKHNVFLSKALCCLVINKNCWKDKAFLHAIIFQESRFNPVIKSPSGALGLMQITPITLDQITRNSLPVDEGSLHRDPAYNVAMGGEYLKYLYNRFYKSNLLVAAAYNAGPSQVSKWLKAYGEPKEEDDFLWIESLPHKETRNYIKNVMALTELYRRYLYISKPISLSDLLSLHLSGEGCKKND